MPNTSSRKGAAVFNFPRLYCTIPALAWRYTAPFLLWHGDKKEKWPTVTSSSCSLKGFSFSHTAKLLG